MNVMAATVARLVLFAFGASLLALGIAIAMGDHRLIPIHKEMGVALVLVLWVIAALAGRGGAGVGLVALACGWGLVTIELGLVQGELVRGEWHWVITVLHVGVSMAAIALGQMLVTRATRAAHPVAAPGRV